MEPVSFAVGIIGLAGLFSTCLDAVERFDSWRDYDSEFRSLVAQFKAQKLRLTKWGLAVGLEDDELSYEHNALLDDPKIESTVKELLLAINAVCRDEDKAFLTPMLGKDEKPTKDQLSYRHTPRESKRQKLGWVLRTKAKRVAQVDQFSKLVETLHDLIPIEGPKEHKGRKLTGGKWLCVTILRFSNAYPLSRQNVGGRCMENRAERYVEKHGDSDRRSPYHILRLYSLAHDPWFQMNIDEIYTHGCSAPPLRTTCTRYSQSGKSKALASGFWISLGSLTGLHQTSQVAVLKFSGSMVQRALGNQSYVRESLTIFLPIRMTPLLISSFHPTLKAEETHLSRSDHGYPK